MNTKKTLAALLATLLAITVRGSGFALYQASASSHALGGALVGKAIDASANFFNPATMTDLTNITVTVGFITEHPRAQVRGRTNGYSWGEDQCMDPGLFWLPHFQLVVPLPFDFAFGLSGMADYGLGSQYSDSWMMNWNSTETTVQGYTLNPNLAYKITDDWSVGIGLRWLFFDFEQYSNPQMTADGSAYGINRKFDLGNACNRLKGDNRWKSLGWQVGTKYDITENFAVGAVYKSAIDVTVDGKTSTTVKGFNDGTIGTVAPYIAQLTGMTVDQSKQVVMKQAAASVATHNGHAEADLTLPQSITAGFNWDITKKVHFGSSVAWTQWSEFDTLQFDLAGGDKNVALNWRDTWRVSFGGAWDFAEDWRWMLSYVYDMDCTDATQSSTMLPPADRHIAATGFAWNCWAGLELALSYSCIFMDGRGMDTTDSLGNSYHMETCRGFCHAVGFSITYRF